MIIDFYNHEKDDWLYCIIPHKKLDAWQKKEEFYSECFGDSPYHSGIAEVSHQRHICHEGKYHKDPTTLGRILALHNRDCSHYELINLHFGFHDFEELQRDTKLIRKRIRL